MPATATQPAATTARAAPPVSPEPPRIVVTVVLDQLGSWVLDRYLPHLPESGALRSAARRGAHYQKVRYQYASTFTAPGHSALYTGVGPSENGVMANRVRDATTNEKVALIDDSEHLVIGDDSKGVSPRALGAPTVADALEEQTGGRSVTVSLSVKDRGAILPGGQRADLALWYETSQRAFTTSTFYRSELPAWLVAWREAHPTRALMHAWEPRDAALLARVAGKDDALGEGDYLGFGTTFPHDPRTGDKPHKLLKLTPQLSEHMLELARAVVVHMGMGQDAVPDLLAISVSGTDYLGHTFGPESWEYLDNLIRVDLALGSFLSWLENEHGPIAVIITSDHGSQALPEQHDGAGRMYPEQLRQAAEKAAAAVAGPGKWIRAFDRPFFYLTAAGRAKRDIVVPAIVEKLTALEGVQLVADTRVARPWRSDADELKRSIGLSINDAPPFDLYLVPTEGWVVDEGRPRGFGTCHGTPWDADRDVPVLFWGPGIVPARHADPVSQFRVAPTIAALLGIEPPAKAREPALER